MKAVDNEKFDVEIVTEGQFVDQGYLVKTIVIRLNSVAMNEFILSDILNCRECYETENEWQEYKTKKTKKREEWENKILQKFGFVKNDKNSFCIAENVSEIFTVVIMERLENGEKDGR